MISSFTSFDPMTPKKGRIPIRESPRFAIYKQSSPPLPRNSNLDVQHLLLNSTFVST